MADDELWEEVYDDLRRRASRLLRRERGGHTLSTTALVHEAYAKLSDQDARYQDRTHFLAVAAMAMRRILVNYARDRAAQKRGGNPLRVTLPDVVAGDARIDEVLAVDDLIDRLAASDRRQSQVVLYKVFAGLDEAEIAAVLGISIPTVRRDWRAAREFILGELGPRPADESTGRRIGPYRLLRPLGAGGWGEVYLAEREGDPAPPVALKLLRARGEGPAMLRRFERERRLLTELNHPHIARLLDAGATDDGEPWFAMEYVDGRPIVAHCRERSAPIPERLATLAEVCAAVDHAHRRQVVHRDLKPDHILVTAEGAPKLLDFGIAKVIQPDSDLTLTDPRQRMLTPQYAAPEQVRGEPATPATDVYALGVVLYELLTDRLPYDVSDVPLTELETFITCAQPPAPSVIAGVDKRLDAICRRTLAADVRDRFDSAARLREELSRLG